MAARCSRRHFCQIPCEIPSGGEFDESRSAAARRRLFWACVLSQVRAEANAERAVFLDRARDSTVEPQSSGTGA